MSGVRHSGQFKMTMDALLLRNTLKVLLQCGHSIESILTMAVIVSFVCWLLRGFPMYSLYHLRGNKSRK
jgi:hypothetical protein